MHRQAWTWRRGPHPLDHVGVERQQGQDLSAIGGLASDQGIDPQELAVADRLDRL